MLLLFFRPLYAEEQLADFSQNSVSVLNEELRLAREKLNKIDTDKYVKADSADTSAGYLSAKVDNDTIKVNSTTHKIYADQNLSNYTQYNDTRYKIGNLSIDLTGATTSTITGVGFQAKSISFSGVTNAFPSLAVGYDDGTTRFTTEYVYNTSSMVNCGLQLHDTGSIYKMNVTDINSDGFNLSWTNGTDETTMTAHIIYKAER